jgi:tetratricopeptide (TPR) repeat protein
MQAARRMMTQQSQTQRQPEEASPSSASTHTSSMIASRKYFHRGGSTSTTTTPLSSLSGRKTAISNSNTNNNNHSDVDTPRTPSPTPKSTATGDHHPMALKQWNSIGNTQFHYGLYGEALESFGKALKGYRAVYGELHATVALSLLHRAITHLRLGQYEESLEGYQSALAIRRKLLGDTHLETGDVWHYLGQLYSVMGNMRNGNTGAMRNDSNTKQHHQYDEHEQHNEAAIQALERALSIRRTRLGKDHVQVARTLGLLAQVYMNMSMNMSMLQNSNNNNSSDQYDYYQKAAELYEHAVRMKRETLGRHHASTVLSMLDVAHCHARIGTIDTGMGDSRLGYMNHIQIALTVYGDALNIQKSKLINLPTYSDDFRMAQHEVAMTVEAMARLHCRVGQHEALHVCQQAAAGGDSNNDSTGSNAISHSHLQPFPFWQSLWQSLYSTVAGSLPIGKSNKHNMDPFVKVDHAAKQRLEMHLHSASCHAARFLGRQHDSDAVIRLTTEVEFEMVDSGPGPCRGC